MPSIDLIAVGKLKNDPLADAFEEYRKRILWKFSLHEVEGKTQLQEHSRIEEKLSKTSALVVLDERGQTFGSRQFASQIEGWFLSHGVIQFVIGGADGLGDDIRGRATMLMSFGKQTWPHMLARVMLTEQIYRAQQILAGHPYHRD